MAQQHTILTNEKKNPSAWERRVEVASWDGEIGSSYNKIHVLDGLISGDFPFLRIQDFASAKECDQLVRAASVFGFSSYVGVQPQIDRLGITVFEHDQTSPEDYLKAVPAARKIQSEVFSASFNVIDRVLDLLKDLNRGTVKIASELDGRPYFAGLIRRIERGTLIHVDFAQAEHSRWSICSSKFQLAWNLYLRVEDGSGPTTLYRRLWRPGDEVFSEGGYGYSSTVVAESASVSFEPKVGEFIMFNSRNYHSVAPSSGDRIAICSAVGGEVHDAIWLWS